MYAVITGASSGIGEQFAKRLAKEGYDLILVARRRERLTALSDKLKAMHKELECDIFTADLMQLDECQRLSDYLEEKDIEIFINNAGYGDCGLFEETDDEKAFKTDEGKGQRFYIKCGKLCGSYSCRSVHGCLLCL